MKIEPLIVVILLTAGLFSASIMPTLTLMMKTPESGITAVTKVRMFSDVTELGPDDVRGKIFKVAVVIENVTDLYGFDIQMNWTTDYIKYIDHNTTVPAGSYPAPNPPSPYGGALNSPTMQVKDVVDENKNISEADPNTMGWFAYAAMLPAKGQNGSATTVVFAFNVTNQPLFEDNIIKIHFIYTALPNSLGIPIAHDAIDLEIPLYGRQPATKVRMISEVDTLGPDDVVDTTFKVAVVIENVTDLYGFDVQLNWTTDYISYVTHTVTVPRQSYPAPNPPSPYDGALGPQYLQVKNEINETDPIPDSEPGAMAWLSYASMYPAVGQNGSATIAVFTFKVVDQPVNPYNATVLIHFVNDDISDSLSMPILHATFDLTIPMYGRPQPQGPTLAIEPETQYYEGTTPHTFSVDLTINNLNKYWDMGGFDIQLSFDKEYAQVVSITEGPFLTTFDYTFQIRKEFNNTEGKIWLAYVQYPSETHTVAYGSGTLFTITFTVKEPGTRIQFLSAPEIGLAGYEHPERPEPPYNSTSVAVRIPYTTTDGTIKVTCIKDHTVTVGGVDYIVTTKSNSTIQNLEVGAPVPMMEFTIDGPEGTVGFCNITIPKALMWSTTEPPEEGWYIRVDGKSLDPSQVIINTDDPDYTYIYFTYSLSTHYVMIITTNIVPEINGLTITLFILAALAISTLLIRKMNKKKHN